MRRRESGQAIVLIALMMSVLIGFVALSVDAGRAFGARRVLQDAVDAASLAAADAYQTGPSARSWTAAQQAGIAIFQKDSNLYLSSYSCSPSLAGSVVVGAAPVSSSCNAGGGYTLVVAVSDAGIEGQRFSFSAQRKLPVALMQVLGLNSDLTILAAATAVVGDQGTTPAIAALGSAGCFGNAGNALSLDYANSLTLVGSMASNGSLSVTSPSVVRVAGDVLGRCGGPGPGTISPFCWPSGSTPPCAATESKGKTVTPASFADPRYAPPAVGNGTPAPPSNAVEVQPGTFNSLANANAPCYFLAGGVYQFNAGYVVNSGIVSNELRPPGAPQFDNNTLPEPKPFWNDNGARCDGDYKAAGVTANPPIQAASYSVVLTSGRNDFYQGQPYERESAPSICHPAVSLNGDQVLKISVSNVPGARWYNVYVQKGGTACAGPFGWVSKFNVGGTPANNNTSGCPDLTGGGSCSLGLATQVFDGGPGPYSIPSNFTASNSLAQAPRTLGAPPPTGLKQPYAGVNPNPNSTPSRSTQWAVDHVGDRANENQCNSAPSLQADCPAAVTPGAVVLYTTGNFCASVPDPGDAYLFSGYQYNWLLNYISGNGTCLIDGSSLTAEIGMTYAPQATINLVGTSEFAAPYFGGLIANQVTFQGGDGLPALVVPFNAAYAPAPPAARLSG